MRNKWLIDLNNYAGLFPTTCDPHICLITRFPHSRVTV